MVKSKNAFLKALIFTVVVFVIGIILGIQFENLRSNNIQTSLMNSEVNLLDEQVQDNAIEQFSLDCNTSKNITFDFADSIYAEALKLEEYDQANKFTSDLTILHKRYDLLRVLLWTESIRIKASCPSSFHTIVYLYDYNTNSIEKKAEQEAISKLLLDFKYKYPDKTLLIPIAANLNVGSVNVILDKYNITKTPAIVIDESKVISKTPTLNGLENIVFQSNNK